MKKVRFSIFAMVLVLHLVPSGWAQELEQFNADCGALSQPGHYPDYERAFSYSVDRREYDTLAPPGLLLQISVSRDAFFGASIVRLACKLEKDFPNAGAMHVLFVDDKKSAQKLRLGYTDQRNYGQYLWHLRGRYELNRKSGQQFVDVLSPDVSDGLLSPRRLRYWLSHSSSSQARQ